MGKTLADHSVEVVKLIVTTGTSANSDNGNSNDNGKGNGKH
jgi:hypothetical protein